MRACKCPNCGANLSFDDSSRDYAFCEYCGAKIDLMDKRTYHTEHIIDEAKIKNAENVSRIVNIFAAPVEEKQRQKEFERQQQAEAARREYERQKRKDEEARENREAMEDGCAAAMGGCLVKCAKHPIIALVIAIAMLGSCMGADSSSSSSKTTSKTVSTSVSSTTSSNADPSIVRHYHYDYCFMDIGAENSRHYWLIGLDDNVACIINSSSKVAYVFPLPSHDFSSGVSIKIGNAVWKLISDDLTKELSVMIDGDGPYNYEPTSIKNAWTDLDEAEDIRDLNKK